ncbi:N-acetylmuramoyl-L-alanine amidase [Enterococcus faecium]|nr:N-acetylmuramoyl-L-alanine amidase [Enterococcus faecium]
MAVEIIVNYVTRGVAGRRSGAIQGAVIHNSWSSATAKQEADRLARMTPAQLEAGFAHEYIDSNTVYVTENHLNRAWHVANSVGNNGFIGYEICCNRNTSRTAYLLTEQITFWRVAAMLRENGLPVNRNTVRLHHTFSATECPKRSLIEHCGYDSTLAVPSAVSLKLQDYFINQVSKFYNNPSMKPGDVIGEQPTSSTPSEHDKAVAASAPVRQGNAIAKLDKFNVFEKGKARVAGWLVPSTPQGPIGKRAFVLIMEHGTNKEFTRIESKGISRPDVKKAYGYQGGDTLGFDVTFDTDWLKGKKIDIILRRCNQSNGEGAVNDVRISDIYLVL